MTVRPVAVRALVAVLVALAVHVFLFLGLVICLECAPQPDVLPALDLSSVELSFAETVDASAAAAVPSRPSAPARPLPREENPPEVRHERVRPPDPSVPAFREPKEPVAQPMSAPSAPAAPRQARVDALPCLRNDIRLDYPNVSRMRGEEGEVLVEISVNATGGVDAVRVVRSSGFSRLDNEAVRAALEAKFEPAQAGKEKVPSAVRLPLFFKLR